MIKKKNLYNLIMAAVILAFLLAGILTAGYLRGWFGGGKRMVTGPDGRQRALEILVEGKKGNAGLTRQGVSFTLEQGQALRDGDRVETRRGAALTLVSGKNTLYLDEKSQAAVQVGEDGTLRIRLESGGIFGVVSEQMDFEVMGTKIAAEEAVFSASAPYGSANLHIFEKSVKVGDQEMEAGQAAEILQGSGKNGENEIRVTELSIQSLSSFEMDCIALAKEGHSLCFTAKEIQELAASRQQAIADVGKAAAGQKPAGGQADPAGSLDAGGASENGAGTPEGEKPDGDGSAAGESSGSSSQEENAGGILPGGSNAGSGGSAPEGSSGGGNPPGGSNTGSGGSGAGGSNAGEPGAPSGGNGGGGPQEGGDTGNPQEPAGGNCTITIVCDTILNNMDSLAEGKDGYVPANGVILPATTVSFSDGETVFDVLKRACGNAGIQLEYSWTPMYDSYYVEGINNLYEFDCGGQSGWMFQVNGWFPNYGCSSCTLSEGDVIVWRYTCKGLGEDVGGGVH